jgi:hypothetical protein
MYKINACPVCLSTAPDTVKDTTATIHQFIAWKSSAQYFWGHIPSASIRCRKCSYVCCEDRLSDEEEFKFYNDYQGVEYTAMRLHSQPWYEDERLNENTEYAIQRRIDLTNSIIDRNIDRLKINIVLDYGFIAGKYPLDRFIKSKQYGFKPYAESNFINLIKFNSQKKNPPFDFIICRQMLEQVSQPENLITMLRDLLNKDGYICFEISASQPSKYQHVFHEKMNFFNIQSLSVLLERLNMELVDSQEQDDTISILTKIK